MVGSTARSIFIVATSAEQVVAADVYGDYRGCGDGYAEKQIPPYRIPKVAARPAWNTEIDRLDIGPGVGLEKPIVGRHIAIADGREESETDRVAERGINNGLG